MIRIEPVENNYSWKLKQTRVNIAGYPNEKSTVPCGSLWHSFDRVIDAFPKINGKVLDLLLYQADTSEGMSGSPVWIKWMNERRYLLGIHSSFFNFFDKNTGQKKPANVAALITPRMVAQWQKWGDGRR